MAYFLTKKAHQPVYSKDSTQHSEKVVAREIALQAISFATATVQHKYRL